MFIDVTRYGGMRILRVAVAAIAYLDAVDGGTAVHLIGGETLRVNEDPPEIELRCMIVTEEADPVIPEPAPLANPVADIGAPVAPAPQKRKKDGA